MLIEILCFELVLSRLRDNGYIFRGTITKGCIFAVTIKRISLMRLLNIVTKRRQKHINDNSNWVIRVYQHDVLIIKTSWNDSFNPNMFNKIIVTFHQILWKGVTANFVSWRLRGWNQTNSDYWVLYRIRPEHSMLCFNNHMETTRIILINIIL